MCFIFDELQFRSYIILTSVGPEWSLIVWSISIYTLPGKPQHEEPMLSVVVVAPSHRLSATSPCCQKLVWRAMYIICRLQALFCTLEKIQELHQCHQQALTIEVALATLASNECKISIKCIIML